MKLVLTIEGMHCASCASNVERSLKKIKGVKEVSVSIMTKKSFIEAEDSVSKDEIKNAVSRVGYKVTALEVD
jgi:Cu+-exporting ATPase